MIRAGNQRGHDDSHTLVPLTQSFVLAVVIGVLTPQEMRSQECYWSIMGSLASATGYPP